MDKKEHKKPIKYYRVEQKFDDKVFDVENEQVMKCYEHFKSRLDERLSNNPGTPGFSFKNYINEWVRYIRGNLLSIDNDSEDNVRMCRLIGNYIKDPEIYEIVYIQIKEIGLFVPLTIYEITDLKRKHKMYKKVLENKKNNIDVFYKEECNYLKK